MNHIFLRVFGIFQMFMGFFEYTYYYYKNIFILIQDGFKYFN